jgi:hypothetical protein
MASHPNTAADTPANTFTNAIAQCLSIWIPDQHILQRAELLSCIVIHRLLPAERVHPQLAAARRREDEELQLVDHHDSVGVGQSHNCDSGELWRPALRSVCG